MTERQTYNLTLTDLGGSPVPVGRRLAQVLKRALRDHRLKCLDVKLVGVTTKSSVVPVDVVGERSFGQLSRQAPPAESAETVQNTGRMNFGEL